jgi:hypothetical protein
MSLAFLLYWSCVAGLAGFAALHGGRDERLAAGAVVVAALLSPLAVSHSYHSPEIGVVLVDVLLFLALAAIALRSAAFWPMWAAGFQLGALAVHFAAARLPSILPAVYAETLAIWAYPVMAAIVIGTWQEAGRHHGQQS